MIANIIVDPSVPNPVPPETVSSDRLSVRLQAGGALLRADFNERVLATNWAPDPTFAYGSGGFTNPAGGSATVDTAQARSGERSLKVVSNSTSVYNTPSIMIGAGSGLRAGDQIRARAWVYVPDMLGPLEQFTALRGSGEVITDASAPGGKAFRWTATEDQTVNSPIITGAAIVGDTERLSGHGWLRGNLPRLLVARFVLLCYGDTGHLGSAGVNQTLRLSHDEWTRFEFNDLELQPGTKEVRFGIYGPSTGSVVGEDFKIGDHLYLADPVLISTAQYGLRPGVRVGGAGTAGKNSDDFNGPVNTWVPLDVDTTVNMDGASVNIYLYAQTPSGVPVWYDDLALAVNEEATEINGDLESDHYLYRWTGTPGNSPSQQYVPKIDAYRVRFTRNDVPVRSGNTRRSPGGTAYAFDQETALDQAALWQAEALGPDGSVLLRTLPVAATVPGGYGHYRNVWLKSVGRPDLSRLLIATDPLPEFSHEDRNALSDLAGSSFQAGTWAPQGQPTTSLSLITQDQQEKDGVAELLAAGPMLVQFEPRFMIDSFYAVPGAVTMTPHARMDTGAHLWTVALTPVPRPATEGARLYIPGNTWQRLIDRYTDYQAVLDAYASYGAVVESR